MIVPLGLGPYVTFNMISGTLQLGCGQRSKTVGGIRVIILMICGFYRDYVLGVVNQIIVSVVVYLWITRQQSH